MLSQWASNDLNGQQDCHDAAKAVGIGQAWDHGQDIIQIDIQTAVFVRFWIYHEQLGGSKLH